MSIYDYRDKPAYENFDAPISYSNNPYILKWWTSDHDQLILSEIKKFQWCWPWQISDEITKFTKNEIIESWKKEDPLCYSYAWYNILMYFAISRAKKLGLNTNIRKPKKKICPICNFQFIENSLPFPLILRLGIENLDFCSPCLRDTILPSTGINNLPKKKIIDYLTKLSEILEFIPTQGFGEAKDDLLDFPFEKKLILIQLFQEKPTIRRVKVIFGSYLKALISANILPDGTRHTSRGINCIAKDGHVCFSLAEKTIDDMLTNLGLSHTKEPHYPESQLRGDFEINRTIVEYFGLIGDSDYDHKIHLKKELCKKHNINLIEIYPKDIIIPGKLKSILLNITNII